MFYTSNGRQYNLHIQGYFQDGKPYDLPLEKWFGFTPCFMSKRYNELVRSDYTVKRLASYLCRRNNAENRDAKLSKITIWDTHWLDVPGLRRPEWLVSKNEKQTWFYLNSESCDKLEKDSTLL
jgi:hypothetical protein